MRVLDTAWSANVTPFQLMRLRGMVRMHDLCCNDLLFVALWRPSVARGNSLVRPIHAQVMRDGPTFVADLLRRRFNNRFDNDVTDLIAEYLW